MMTSPGILIRRERERLGLSTRDLATLAEVSYPTISRIEHGHEQPRWDTLQRIARALGKTINLGLDDEQLTRIAELADTGVPDAVGDLQPDWTRLRGFVDRLRLHPELTAAAIVTAPPASGSSLIDNLLAAIAEKLADDVGIRRPNWTMQIPPMETPWVAPGTPRMNAASAAATPPRFAARNIVLPASAIWRDRHSVPA
jgi:transcriptional regulator with XRE-family HTH domain